MSDIVEDGVEGVDAFGTETVGLAGRIVQFLADRFYGEKGPYSFDDVVIDGDIRTLAAKVEALIRQEDERLLLGQAFFEIIKNLLPAFLAAFIVQAHFDDCPLILRLDCFFFHSPQLRLIIFSATGRGAAPLSPHLFWQNTGRSDNPETPYAGPGYYSSYHCVHPYLPCSR